MTWPGSGVVTQQSQFPCLRVCAFLSVQQHRFTYNEPMPVESCTQSLCDLALRFGEDSDDAGGMVSPKSQQQCLNSKSSSDTKCDRDTSARMFDPPVAHSSVRQITAEHAPPPAVLVQWPYI